MKHSIADLHCDLLLYLCGAEGRSAYDQAARCSIPQMVGGQVAAQVLPVFTMTNAGSSLIGWEQTEIFKKLPDLYPDDFEIVNTSIQLEERSPNRKLGVLLAFENASSFADEKDDLDEAFQKLSLFESRWAKIVYISMTWNSENRFGGGAETKVGLKDDGKHLLNFLHKRRIAIDLSHTSDYLAYDIFNHMEKNNLEVPVLASHSNFRSVQDHARNLPDAIAKEIMRRQGVIGLNFIRSFVGPEESLSKQLEFGLSLGGEDRLCFGADFFFEGDLDQPGRPPKKGTFFEKYSNSGCYPAILDRWRAELDVPEIVLDKIAFSNIKKFLQKQILN